MDTVKPNPPSRTPIAAWTTALDEPQTTPKGRHGYQDRASWMGVLLRLMGDGVGVAGVRHIFNPSIRKSRRWMWVVLVLAGVCIASAQIVDRLVYYVSKPKNVDVTLKYVKEVEFPSVAICNINSFKYSKMRNTPIGDFFESIVGNPNPDFSEYEDLLSNYELGDMYLNLGHSFNETANSMLWGDQLLTADNFTARLTDWGLCFIFNDIDNGLPGLTVHSAGRLYGLRVVLDAQQREYFYQPSYRVGAGFQVLVYERGSFPAVEFHGFSVSVGMETSVALDTIEYENLEHPVGDCYNKTLSAFPKYGFQECLFDCAATSVWDRCQCRPFFIPGDAPPCSLYTFYTCVTVAFDLLLKNVTCDCEVGCKFREYPATITTMSYPSNFWMQHREDMNLTPDQIRENVCALHVFMADLSVERIRQFVDYSIPSLLSDIGGALGLWLGGSILTVFELVDVLSHTTCVYAKHAGENKAT